MQFGPEARRPAQDHVIRTDKFGAVGRVRIVSRPGRNCETPDVAFPRAIRIGLVNLVDSPIIGCSPNQAVRIGKSREACYVKRHGLVAPEQFGISRGLLDIA